MGEGGGSTLFMIEHILANLQSIGIFIIFLGILITVHEWGHFITAKKLGINVEEFALGFGPTLLSKPYNGTNYMIKLFPLGGYVKMAGDERDRCKGLPEEFLSKPPGHRALVVLNGPVVNFVLAYVCLVLVFMLGFSNPSTVVVGMRQGLPAQVSGVQLGDKIVEVDGQKVFYLKEIISHIAQSTQEQVQLKILRNGQEIVKNIESRVVHEKNMIGQYEDKRTIGLDANSSKVGGFSKDGPAEVAGFQVGDRIVEINGHEVFGWQDLQKTVSESKEKAITIKILREGQELTKIVAPEIKKLKTRSGEEKEKRMIGVGAMPEKWVTHKFNLWTALGRGYHEFVDITTMTYKALYAMVTGSMSARESVGGPVLIFNIVKEASALGFSHFLFILGVISLNLAIFNLLPIIPLDGGHLFLLAIEKIRGRALSPKADDLISRVGLSLMILLALYVFYIDFERIGLISKIKGIFH